jgi:hypothetical protein
MAGGWGGVGRNKVAQLEFYAVSDHRLVALTKGGFIFSHTTVDLKAWPGA